MPELPEVETVARQLAPALLGRSVRSMRILDPLLRVGRTPRLAGREILQVSRSGKRVMIVFSAADDPKPDLWLAVHLRMTGRLQCSAEPPAAGLPHLRAVIGLDRGSLLFIDTRRFGTFHWYRSREEGEPDGIDPLSSSMTPAVLKRLLGQTRQNIKAWLLRQDRLVGLGNIYASEILFASRISPHREAGSFSIGEIRRLHGAIQRILRRAIDNCGTTFSDFQDAHGVTGSYQVLLKVYGRGEERCPRCRETILREVQQQRSTFHCPGCQS